MAVDYKILKLMEASEKVLDRITEIKKLKDESRPLIDIQKLNVSEEIIPLLKNVNTFLSLNEYERASDAADKIISQYPDSAAGWFAKTVAITDNFFPVNFNQNSEDYNATKKQTYLNYKKNTLKMASQENTDYVSECFDEYDKICAYTTSMYTFSLNFQLWGSLSGFNNLAEYKPALVRETLAKVFVDCPNYETSATDNPDDLILCLFYELHYINHQNYKNQCQYYGVSEKDSLLDYYKNKPIRNVTLEKTSLMDTMKNLNLHPKQSDCIEYDGFISLVYSICDTIEVNPGNISKYYSPETQVEIRELEKQEAERIREEERQKKVAREKALEEARRKELEIKAKKRRSIIIKLVIVAIAITACMICIKPVVNFVKDNFGSSKSVVVVEETTENINREYYVISDKYSSINVRSGAGTNYSIVTQVHSKSVRLYPTGKTSGNWIEVSSDDFGVGWVSKNIVKLVKD